jgi:predicted  nucleic acid-binding Zn-ribbon protein
MLPIIEALLVLQDKDRRLIRLRAELEAVPVQRQLLQTKAAKTQAAFDEVKKRSTHVESERKRLELEAGTLQQRINKLKSEQLGTRSNDQYKAFQHQIETTEGEIRGLEDRQIEMMEQAEVISKDVQEASKIAAAQKSETDRQLGDLAVREANLKKEFDAVSGERAGLASKVEPIALARYERILKTKGDNVLVGVHRVVCGGCHVKLPMQVCLHAKAQLEIASCPNCGRMLYFTPDMDV